MTSPILMLVAQALRHQFDNDWKNARYFVGILGDFVEENFSSPDALSLLARIRSENGPSLLDLCDCMVKLGCPLCKRRVGKFLACIHLCGHVSPRPNLRKALKCGMFRNQKNRKVWMLRIHTAQLFYYMIGQASGTQTVPRNVTPRNRRIRNRVSSATLGDTLD